jgi:hypothetical protein
LPSGGKLLAKENAMRNVTRDRTSDSSTERRWLNEGWRTDERRDDDRAVGAPSRGAA